MLVLSRKLEEKIRIGEFIEVQVVEIKGKTVRLGISAPKDIPVIRTEIDDRPGGMDNRK
jgi:carbon storage regulator